MSINVLYTLQEQSAMRKSQVGLRKFVLHKTSSVQQACKLGAWSVL